MTVKKNLYVTDEKYLIVNNAVNRFGMKSWMKRICVKHIVYTEFPCVRSIVAQLTSAANIPALLLPVINITETFKN